MIYRELYIGRWHVYFFFCPDGYDEEAILDKMYDIDASDYYLLKASRKMKSAIPNEGFTFANGDSKEAVVVIGPTTSGAEFQNTLVHEIHHLAVAIASELGIDLEAETPAYIAGDAAKELSGAICSLGCEHCREQ